MQIEKRLIYFQTFISISFLTLPVNYILKNIINNNIMTYIEIGIFIILLTISFFMLRRSKELVDVSKNAININKYLTYTYIISYIFLIFISRDEDINIKHYFLISLSIISSLIAVIYNAILLKRIKN